MNIMQRIHWMRLAGESVNDQKRLYESGQITEEEYNKRLDVIKIGLNNKLKSYES